MKLKVHGPKLILESHSDIWSSSGGHLRSPHRCACGPAVQKPYSETNQLLCLRGKCCIGQVSTAEEFCEPGVQFVRNKVFVKSPCADTEAWWYVYRFPAKPCEVGGFWTQFRSGVFSGPVETNYIAAHGMVTS